MFTIDFVTDQLTAELSGQGITATPTLLRRAVGTRSIDALAKRILDNVSDACQPSLDFYFDPQEVEEERHALLNIELDRVVNIIGIATL